MGDYQQCYKCVVTYPPPHTVDQMEEGQFMCCGVVEPSLVTKLWTAHNAGIVARCWSSCV